MYYSVWFKIEIFRDGDSDERIWFIVENLNTLCWQLPWLTEFPLLPFSISPPYLSPPSTRTVLHSSIVCYELCTVVSHVIFEYRLCNSSEKDFTDAIVPMAVPRTSLLCFTSSLMERQRPCLLWLLLSVIVKQIKSYDCIFFTPFKLISLFFWLSVCHYLL
jgi:hypothetical protein